MINKIVKEDIDTIVNDIKKEAKVLEGKTILITGSAGFLGSYFLAVLSVLNQKLFKKPAKVICIDNYITGEKENILGDFKNSHFKFYDHDIVKPLKPEGEIDYIIHAAGIASPVYYMKHPLETIEVATKGTQNMLELARIKKPRSMLFFSSSEIYGDPHPEYIPTPASYRGHVSSTGPRSCYDESKRLGETLCMTYFRLHQVPVRIVRPFNVYGPGMKPNDYRVMPRFLTGALNGETLPIHGSGMQTRTYCYATDSIAGFFRVLLLGEAGEVYNIGNDQNEINLVVLAEMVNDLFHGNVKINKVPYPVAYPADEPSRRCPDITKAYKKFKYRPKVEIRTGLARLLQWYKDEFFS